jgi:hypothetical protein
MSRRFQPIPYGTAHTLETLHERCIEEGECWLWQAGTSHGTPAIRHNGKVVHVRRYIIEELQGIVIPEGRRVSMTCDNKTCINPDHIRVYRPAALLVFTAARTGYALDPLRNARIAARRQEQSALTWEIVRKIRAMEGSDREIARATGYAYSTINNIRSNRSWVETSPWAGLLAA